MSTVRLTQAPRATRQLPARASLRAINLSGLTNSPSSRVVVATITLGAVAIAIFQLLLHIATSSSVYELSHLQTEKRELSTTTQILGQQVDSLASQQNLANAAEKLGMISNANPVFLRLADQKVFGKPTAALTADGRVSRNLVPNAAMTRSSVIGDPSKTADSSALDATSNSVTGIAPLAANASPVNLNVAEASSKVRSVVSSSGGIPASPTH
jgi:cell division protein FtsL